MATGFGWEQDSALSDSPDRGPGFGFAIALAAIAAVGAGIAVQQLLQRRLSKPEMARLRFYRYLRERGHLES
ncbi:MAG: hypothetical protein ACR2JC_10060 [Chloroflexota bacterium]|nr:MAG: hypothetical protein DLM70_18030 [Chloroflexota bacterium]